MGILWHSHRPADLIQATWNDVVNEAQAGGYQLIQMDALYDLYRTAPAGLRFVDTRQTWEFRSGYIQGAVNFPIEPTWWGRWRQRGPLKRLLGEDKTAAIVFY